MNILTSPVGSQHNSGSGGVSESAFEDGLLDLGVPVQVQIFLWRQIAPFIRPKLGKLHEASCMVGSVVENTLLWFYRKHNRLICFGEKYTFWLLLLNKEGNSNKTKQMYILNYSLILHSTISVSQCFQLMCGIASSSSSTLGINQNKR